MKRAHTQNAKHVVCDKCLVEDNSSISGKRHRRCAGQPGSIRAKHDLLLPGTSRGKWS